MLLYKKLLLMTFGTSLVEYCEHVKDRLSGRRKDGLIIITVAEQLIDYFLTTYRVRGGDQQSIFPEL